MAHTLGPWKFSDSPAWGYSAIWNPETQQEILVPDGRNEDDRPETWMGENLSGADKALIEAAPDLLVALKGLVEEWDEGLDDPFWDAARAAIAKAEATVARSDEQPPETDRSLTTTHYVGETITFYNGGQVIIDRISDKEIGFRKYYPAETNPHLVRMPHDRFEEAIRIPYGATEGNMA